MSSSQPNTALNQSPEAVIADILKEAAERSPDLERAVLWCAVTRWFDAEVVKGMFPPRDAPAVSTDEIIQYLSSLPFCEAHPTRDRAWMFREEFRANLLKHEAVTDHWDELQSRAAGVFKKRFDIKASEGERKFEDRGLKDIAIEYVYHLQQLDPLKALKAVRQICAETLAVLTSSSGRPEVVFCSRFLGGLDWPPASEQVEQDLSFLRSGISALLTENDVKALQMLYKLAEFPELTAEQKSALHDWIGEIHLWDEGRLGPALEQFEMAERLTPKDVIVHARIAEVYYTPGPTWGRFDLAEEYAHKAVALATKRIDNYVGIAGSLALGEIAKLQENYDEALGLYQKAINVDPNTVNTYLSQSEVYSARGELIRALDKIDEALKVSPDIKYYALVRRGNAYRDARHYKEALKEYAQARDEAPDRIDAYIEVGRVQAILWHVAEAERAYRKAIGLKPEAVDGHAALARLYEQQGRLGPAIDVCLEAKKKGIESKELYVRLSYLYGQQNRLEDLRQVQKELVQLDPAEEYAAHCASGDAWLAKAWRRGDDQFREQWQKEAQSEYDKALAIDSHRAWAYLSVAKLAVLRNDSDKAQEQKRQISERSGWAQYDMLVSLGRAYLDNFKYAEAEKELQAAVELAPRRIAGWQALSELYYQQCDTAGVLRVWSKLVDINSTLAYDRHFRVGEAYQRGANHARARAEYTRAKEIDSETYDPYWALAEIAEAESKWDEAIANYRIVTSKAPGLASIAYVRIARILLSQEKNNEAEEAVRTAIRLDSEEPLGYIELARLGVVQQQEALVNEGRQLLESVSRDQLYDFDNAIADEYRLAGNLEKAEQAYRECLRRDPERAEAYIGLGKLRLSQERPQGAEEWLPQALKIDRTNVEIYLAIAEMYEKLDRLDEAEQQFRTAIRLSPWRSDVYVYFGSLLHRRHKSEEAREVYQKAKDAAGVSYLDLGSYYELQRKLDDALQVYRIGLECESAELIPDFRMALASLYSRLNKLEQAKAEYKQAIELAPKRREAYENLAQLLAAEDRLDEALEVYGQMANQPELAYAAQILTGNLLAGHEKYGEAEQSYRQAIKVNPKEAEAYLQLALLYHQRARHDETEQILHQASEAVPNNPEPLRLLAQLREQEARWDEAIRLYRRVLELEPAGAASSEAHQRIGSLLIEQRRYDEAKQELQKAVQSDPANAEAYYGLGTVYEQQGNVERALESYTKVTEIAPKYRDGYVACLGIYANQKDTQSLARIAQRILELDLEPAEKYDAYLVIASAHQTAEDTKQAETTYLQAIKLAPENPEAYIRLAQLLANENRVDEALEVCRQMAKQPELAYNAQISIGNLLAAKEAYSEATQAYHQAIEIDPKQVDAYVQLAGLYQQQNKLDEMEPLLHQASEAAPGDPEPLWRLAQLKEQQERWEESIKLYRRVVELQPSGSVASDAYQRIGSLLVDQKRYDEAEQELQRAVESDPTNGVAYYNLATVCEQQGQVERALKNYTKATEIAPKYGEAYQALGRIYARQGDTESLAKMARHMLELELKPVEKYNAYLIIANAYQEVELERAIGYLEEAVSLDPKRHEAYSALGVIYQTQQRWARAREVYKKIGQLSPESQSDVHLRLGQLFVAEQNPEEAEKEFRQVNVEALEPNDERLDPLTSGYLNTASIYRRQGKLEAMRKACEEVVSLVQRTHSADPNVLRHQGLAYLMRGEYAEASQTLRQALKANPADIKSRLYLAVNLLPKGEPAEAQSQLKQAIEQAQNKDDYIYAIEEAEVLAAHVPEVAGAKEILQALLEARDKPRSSIAIQQ